jgi:hypothetical protein
VTSERECDQALVERVQAGDRRAFDLLVIKYQRRLMRLVTRLVYDPAEAEDVVQETFIKALPGAAPFPRRLRLLYLAVPDRHQHGKEFPRHPGPACTDLDGNRCRTCGRI